MKISQMTTDQAADVMVRIAEPVANIMHDESVLEMLQKMMSADTNNPVKFIADNLGAITAALLKARREDVYEIVAALSGKTAEEVAGQKITQTIKDIKDSWDGELVDFFGSAGA